MALYGPSTCQSLNKMARKQCKEVGYLERNRTFLSYAVGALDGIHEKLIQLSNRVLFRRNSTER
jgi:hypothetical protein